MNIIVLDGFCINPGDLDWSELKKLGNVEIYDRTPDYKLMGYASGAHILLVNKTYIDKHAIDNLESLQYIGIMATGSNIVDTDAATQRKVLVSNVPDYGTEAVAQHTFALIFSIFNPVAYHAKSVREGGWSRKLDWCYWDVPINSIHNKVIGIVGYGKIGKKVARIAKAFDMEVLVYTQSPEKNKDFKNVSLTDLCEKSDIISLHCPLTEMNRGLVDESFISKMKRSAVIINTSRGGLIDENILSKALIEKRIAGAGLDVLTTEPPSENNPLIGLNNCIITPHQAWASFDSRKMLMNTIVSNVKSFLNGNPENIINYKPFN